MKTEEEIRLLKEILEWESREKKLENKEYRKLLPEYNPKKEELYSFAEIKEFVDGALEGLLIAYNRIFDNTLRETIEKDLRVAILDRIEVLEGDS